MEIKDVTVLDAGDLLNIYAPYVENTAISFECTAPTLSEFANRIKTISAKYPYIKAEINGETVGYAYANTFKPREAYKISAEVTVYVKENFKGNGIGTALYTELEKRLKVMGIKNMYACVIKPETEDEYLTNASFNFHTKKGFRLVGQFNRCGIKFGRYYNMVFFEKEI